MRRIILLISFLSFVIGAQAQNEISKKILNKIEKETPSFFELQSHSTTIESTMTEELGMVEEFEINRETILNLKEKEFLSLSLNYHSQPIDVVLYESNVLSESFKIYENNGSSTIEVTDQIDLGKQYWGMINDDINSLVTMTISPTDEMMLMVSSLENEFVVHPAQPGSGKYMAYRNEELILPEPETSCELLRVNEVNTSSDPPILQNPNVDGCSATSFVPITVVADFDMFQDFGSSVSNTTTYIVDLMTQVTALYAAEDIPITLSDVFVNTAEDGYPHTSSIDDLSHFQNNLPSGAQGNLLQLLSTTNQNIGGVAYLNVICNQTGFNIGYSNIFGSFNEIPTYSWDVNVLGHEIGHNLGAEHTHSCAYGPSTVDDCGNVAFARAGQIPEGQACWNATNPTLPFNGGSIMSYCHLINGVGVNLSIGLLEPGDLIRQRILEAENCLPLRGITELVTLPSDNSYTTITANRFCENGNWIEYFFDNNTADDFDDDIYVLAINPNGLNTASFTSSDVEVSLVSTTDGNRNGGIQATPDYKTNPNDLFLAKRFWKVEMPNQPSRPVGVRFPITQTDLDRLQQDVSGTQFTNLAVLSLTENADFDPENLHTTIQFNQVDEYMFGSVASNTEFTVENINSVEYLLEFQSQQLYGGSVGVTSNKGNVKPFVLDTFTATVNDSFGVDLNWTTAEEFNSQLFLIDKSFNGEPFVQIGTRNASGFSETTSSYSFNEQFAFVGETRYRLKMIGERGTVIVSEEILLEGNEFGDTVQLFPNPVVDGNQMVIDLRSIFPIEGDVELTIFNSNGQLIKTLTTDGQVSSMPISGFAAGTYFLDVRTENSAETIQFIVTN